MEKKTSNRLKKGETAAKYSTLVNLFLAIIKGVVGVLSGSIALIADSVHSFSDIFASLAVYIGLRFSRRKPDEKFPYGYYKFETLASLVISVIIIITGFDIIVESLNGISTPKTIEIPLIALSVAVLSVAVSLLLARYKERVGNEIGSPALISDGKHSLVDVFSSIIVFVGILSAYIGYPVLQSVASFAVALLIMYIGLKFGKEAILVLLDACIDPGIVENIKSIATNFEGVEGVHDIKVRRSGPFVFAELHLGTKKRLPIQKADEISRSVEKLIKKEINDLDTITIKIEGEKKLILRIAAPLVDNKGLMSNISKHFAKSPYFLIADITNGKIKKFQIKKNPSLIYERKRGLKTVEFLKNEDVDIVLFEGEVKEGPTYALSDELIKVLSPDGITLEEILLNAAIKEQQ
ncbi:cation diffusion facilitator family transporter [Methanobacterium sp.]|uniref:cation diffusion facilitator family transporter n=1 Tax=Methanobacterium sp. TaxID=2164 RepID=UPI0025F29847|nr:cation diffusion facilitator family transporter [Methanobacterium sp.]MBI5458740.1 cation diffusion facilitator family transporter [Methanobacterium sp.]